MNTCKVSELFEVKYGVNLELVRLDKKSDGINFVSRTSKNNGVSAKVASVITDEPLPAGTITVAVGGSVMETFLQIKPYYSGRDIYYLTPRFDMSNEVKLFYCLCLKSNKYKFSYGRQANITLEDLQIPKLEFVPDFVKNFSLKKYATQLLRQKSFENINNYYSNENVKIVPLNKIFTPYNGIASSQVLREKTKKSENWIPYIRPSYRQETSIDAYVNKTVIPSNKIFPPNSLYISTDGQGSHTFSYVSTFEFVPNSNVSVLMPKREMGINEKLFYAHCITNNRYKFSYGRKPKGERLESIMIPEYPPKYVMEYDINTAISGFEAVLEKM